MTVNFANSHLTNDAFAYDHLLSVYKTAEDNISKRRYVESYSSTASINYEELETADDVIPYELLCNSGGLSFWDEPEEDIYSFDDGEEV